MNKHEEKLDSFVQFMSKHPELRFWQGLLAWTKEQYKDPGTEAIYFGGEYTGYKDTFYLE